MIHLGGSNHDERENLQECQIVKSFQNWLREIFSKLSGNDSHEVGEIFSIFPFLPRISTWLKPFCYYCISIYESFILSCSFVFELYLQCKIYKILTPFEQQAMSYVLSIFVQCSGFLMLLVLCNCSKRDWLSSVMVYQNRRPIFPSKSVL